MGGFESKVLSKDFNNFRFGLVWFFVLLKQGFLAGLGFKFKPESKTQNNLTKINEWTNEHQMKLNTDKTKYIIFNFCSSYEFRTRLMIKDCLLEQVHEMRLLGIILQDDLSWTANTRYLVKRAYTRTIILR